jgi:hypothetical protein
MSTFAAYFVAQIVEDLGWREAELAILRKQLTLTKAGTVQEATFLRTNLAMVYAHYEGFCKFSLGVYIDAMEKQNLKPCDLKWSIAAPSLKKFHAELRDTADVGDFFTLLLDSFEKHLNDKPLFERPENIANLWPDLLARWMVRLGLDSKNIQAESFRLKTLVDNRNHIAHGKKLTISSRTELDQVSNSATLAMHEVAVGIAYALEQRLYLRKAPQKTTLGHAIDS